jgi:flagellar export protein FliJ
MARFRFRAQAALDLRIREHDVARRALAAADAAHRGALAALDEATLAVAKAGVQAAETLATGCQQPQLDWYRSWIVGLRNQRATRAAEVTRRERDLTKARAACVAAKQRLDALERLREEARHAWERAMLAKEQRELDALATMRFVALRRADQARGRLDD